MRFLLSLLLSEGGMVLVWLATALWTYARPQSVRARRVMLAGAIAYTLLATYAVNYSVGRLLSIGYQPYSPSARPSGPTAIVVLGVGGFTALDWSNEEFSIVGQEEAARVVEAARVYRLLVPDWVVTSGGKPYPSHPHEASGITMRDALVQLGVPESRIVIETSSRTTRDEAMIVAPMLKERGVEHVVLVTAAVHMRRSLGAFRAAGVRALPAIARDPYVADTWRDWLIPGGIGLWKGKSVFHEVAGLAYYSLRGWYR